MRAAAVAALPVVALAGSALAVPVKAGNFTLTKKDFTNERFTWYNPSAGIGACGQQFSDSDFVVALNEAQYSSSYCFQNIEISYNGKSTTAEIVDMCPGCPYGGLDLSPALFDFLTFAGAAGGPNDPGVIYGEWNFGGSSAPSAPSQPSSGGNRIHPNGDTSKCLDVQGANFANGTPVQIYDCNGTNAQNWIINSGQTAVQVAGTNYCLDAGTSPADGTQMKIWQCYSGLAQQTWYYTGDQRIALENQGFCLDDTNGSHNDGTVTQIWECTNNDNNQVWTLS